MGYSKGCYVIVNHPDYFTGDRLGVIGSNVREKVRLHLIKFEDNFTTALVHEDFIRLLTARERMIHDICEHCNHKMEAEFVDIGIGSMQVTDYQCTNDSCPELIKLMEKYHNDY